MATLTTLRDLAGIGHQPAALSESALVIIDCQNTYRRGVMQLVDVEPAPADVARLLTRARSAGVPIFHIMHDAGPGTPYDVHADIGQISDPVKPLADEPVIVKKHPNSFWETDLDSRLRAMGVQNLVLCGFMTHVCVNSTARGAFNLGYRATVVADATATRDLFAVVVPRVDDLPA